MAGCFERAKYNLKKVFRLTGINAEHLATNIVLYPAVKGSTLIQCYLCTSNRGFFTCIPDAALISPPNFWRLASPTIWQLSYANRCR